MMKFYPNYLLHLLSFNFLVDFSQNDLSFILLNFSENSDNTGIVVISVTPAVIPLRTKSIFLKFNNFIKHYIIVSIIYYILL